jgi:hypothetical protein
MALMSLTSPTWHDLLTAPLRPLCFPLLVVVVCGVLLYASCVYFQFAVLRIEGHRSLYHVVGETAMCLGDRLHTVFNPQLCVLSYSGHNCATSSMFDFDFDAWTRLTYLRRAKIKKYPHLTRRKQTQVPT